MEISQYSTSQISGKVTLAALQAFLSNPKLAQVLYYGNVSGGNHIDMTSGDLIRALGNSYNNLTLETSFNQLS
ncbi:hypothetical protein, partial [Collinsella tanakaei]|uniref:hypothetical protein n=1 Tax=Collinsella tanakaei TaxID=626935 RepID=UPI00195A2BC1